MDWLAEHRRLWRRLVPASGPAGTVQGEVIRCVGRLADEAYRNGNANWANGFEGMVRFAARTLDDPATFDDAERRAIREAADSIVAGADAPDLSGRAGPYYRLTEMAVRWCLAHPEPLPREADPATGA
jgi:hypothetical protein